MPSAAGRPFGQHDRQRFSRTAIVCPEPVGSVEGILPAKALIRSVRFGEVRDARPSHESENVLHRETSSRLSETRATAAHDPPALLASVRQLMILRTIAVSGQVAAIAVSTALGVTLPLLPMIAVIALLV